VIHRTNQLGWECDLLWHFLAGKGWELGDGGGMGIAICDGHPWAETANQPTMQHAQYDMEPTTTTTPTPTPTTTPTATTTPRQ
jgi:hypothetical protein